MAFEPKLATSGIGSLPYQDAEKSVEFVKQTCPDIPYWPQLPKMNQNESMISQFAEGLPGLSEDESLFVNIERPDLGQQIEEFIGRIAKNDILNLGVSEQRAAGLYALSGEGKYDCMAVKGQVTGPVSFGLSLVDQNGKYLIYNEMFRDIYVKLLAAKVGFVNNKLSEVSDNVIVFADEPLLYTYGSAYFNLDREILVNIIKDVFSGFGGLKGIHACHNCDWSIIFEVRPDIISFDAYSYLDKFLIYEDQLAEFLTAGGIIAWGIVPTTDELYLQETTGSLSEKIEKAFETFDKKGLDVAGIAKRSIITPADGVGTLSEDHAKRVFELNSKVSERLKELFI